MEQRKVNYIFSAVIIVLALVLGYFGVTLPITPDIPEPLTMQDVQAIVQQETLDLAVPDVTRSYGVYQTNCRMEQGGDQWTAASGCIWQVQSGATLDIQSGAAITLAGYVTSTLDSLTVNGNATITGTSNLVGDTTLGGLLLSSFSNVTIDVAGEVLTPTKTAYALDSSGAITMTLAASGSEGQLLVLMGDDNNTVTINDTNIRSSDGNAIDIGQYDTVIFVYQDSEWLEIAKSANQ